jgi:c-di-GMP-binding flagellar brake protein YcgR
MPKVFDKKIKTEDSRQTRRFRSFCLLKYSISSSSVQKTTIVNPRNISAKGASFISDDKLSLDVIFEADIYLPPLKDFVTVMAKTVRVLKIKDTQEYWVGVRFTAIDPADKIRINSYIEDAAKDPQMYRYLDKKGRYFKRRSLAQE